MKINMSSTREKFPLSTRKVLKKTVSATIGYVIILAALYALFTYLLFVTDSGFGLPGLAISLFLVLAILIVLGAYLYQRWYYAVYFYDLTPDYIVIKKGPITPQEITIPYERIQDVYVDQDLLDRIFGIYDVHLSSATISSGMQAHIDGVDKQAAEGLRALLLQTVQQKISRK